MTDQGSFDLGAEAETVKGLRPWQGGTVTPDTPPARIERLAPEDAFDGATYVPELDYDRLGAQMRRVWDALQDHEWWTLSGLASTTGDPEASVSARLRDLRKKKLGGYTVERKRAAGGLWIYRLKREDED